MEQKSLSPLLHWCTSVLLAQRQVMRLQTSHMVIFVQIKCFAPNINQMHVIDHTNGNEMQESRNVLVEAARCARLLDIPLP